jgi:hypothetical protein
MTDDLSPRDSGLAGRYFLEAMRQLREKYGPEGKGMTDEGRPATLEQAVRDELVQLWGDLTTAVRTAHNGCWSPQCENLADRIIALARFVGATRWSAVDCTLLRSGVYERILTAAGIGYEPVDWDAVAKTEAYIASTDDRG